MSVKEKIEKNFKSAMTACGFLIGHYIYIAIYQFYLSSSYGSESKFLTGLIYAVLVAIFVWLVKKAKEEKSFSNLITIFLVYFGERISSLTTFLDYNNTSTFLVQLAITLPIIILLFRGLKTAVFCHSVKGKQGILESKKRKISRKVRR